MDAMLSSSRLCPAFFEMHMFFGFWKFGGTGKCGNHGNAVGVGRVYYTRPPQNLRYPRRTKLPPDLLVDTFPRKKRSTLLDPSDFENSMSEAHEQNDSIDENIVTDEFESGESEDDHEEKVRVDDDVVWDQEEIDAISSLFRGRIPQKPGKLDRERPLPLTIPHKTRPVGLPCPKKRVKTAFRQSMSEKVYKNPRFLIGLAKEIRNLAPEDDVSKVLNKWGRFLRKGSLSLTIRELGHMGLPEKSLHIFCWAQKQPHLFPDDKILATTVEVLAMSGELKMPFELEKFLSLASQSVYEAAVRGLIKGGSLKRAYKLVSAAKNGKRILSPGIYSMLILELGKNPDNHDLVLALLEELGEREDIDLRQEECTAIMKICTRMGKFETAETLFDWFKNSGRRPSVVMYTTMIHSLYSRKSCREAMAVVWEMEESDCLLDLPAYRVVIQLFAALNDLPRTVRYFSKLKEAGFSPSFDIFMSLINIYASHGRLAKCKEVCEELEMSGFKLDEQIRSSLMHLEK